ncbi:hypothetical protein ACFL6U_12920 [Planctomycetota bacterium]
MQNKKNISETFIPLRSAAHRLGVPFAWLKREVDTGNIPCLQVGRRLLANVQLLEESLLALVNKSKESKDEETCE